MVGVLPRLAGAGIWAKFLGLFFCCLVCGWRLFFSVRLLWPLGFVSLWFVLLGRLVVGRGFFASLAGPLCGGFWGRVGVFGSGFVVVFCPFFIYE